MRAVIDTNVIVSGLILARGNPAEILRALRDKRFLAIVSPQILEEIAAALSRDWLQTDYGIEEDDVRGLLRLLALRSELVEPHTRIRRCRDPRDDIFLEAAVDGRAHRIVSGDKDVLEIGSIEGIRIVPPADFVTELG
jgi:hypothetical protein